MKWMRFEPNEGEKINVQGIKLLADPSVICTMLFAIKENKDGSKSPVFLLSQNFRDGQLFVDDFMKLLEEHAKFNQVKT